jgi:putative methyltransferase (TIGR04325 family)
MTQVAQTRLSRRVADLAARLLPPIVVEALGRLPLRRALAGPPEWEYVPEGWRTGGTLVRGWNDSSVLETERQRWAQFLRAIEGTQPLAVAHEMPDAGADDYIAHNIIMAYGYVLGLAAHGKEALSVLDWGGGLGHYYALARRLLLGVALDYHCKDVPLMCHGGRALLPEVKFHESEAECFARSYDLVLASSSLQYTEDWKGLVARLAPAADGYLYITRLPIVRSAPSFVVVQRPHAYGYATEYLGRFLNKDEFVDHVLSQGMELVREFLVQEKPYVCGAPEQGQYHGFLFRPRRGRTAPIDE